MYFYFTEKKPVRKKLIGLAYLKQHQKKSKKSSAKNNDENIISPRAPIYKSKNNIPNQQKSGKKKSPYVSQERSEIYASRDIDSQ